jgi:hypothetical protein
MPEEKAAKSRRAASVMSDDQRKLIGNAIIEGLLDPGSFTFYSPIATEGGDYDQGDGSYNQSGGGTHNQGSGDYNQSALTSRFDPVRVTNVLDVLERIQTLRR